METMGLLWEKHGLKWIKAIHDWVTLGNCSNLHFFEEYVSQYLRNGKTELPHSFIEVLLDWFISTPDESMNQ